MKIAIAQMNAVAQLHGVRRRASFDTSRHACVFALEAGARVLLVLNASPCHRDKQAMRYSVTRQRAAATRLAIVYVNMVGRFAVLKDIFSSAVLRRPMRSRVACYPKSLFFELKPGDPDEKNRGDIQAVQTG